MTSIDIIIEISLFPFCLPIVAIPLAFTNTKHSLTQPYSQLMEMLHVEKCTGHALSRWITSFGTMLRSMAKL